MKESAEMELCQPLALEEAPPKAIDGRAAEADK